MLSAAPAGARPASGLAGVRAFAGLGSASTCACSRASSGLGAELGEIVKSPIFLGIAGILLVAGVVFVREVSR